MIIPARLIPTNIEYNCTIVLSTSIYNHVKHTQTKRTSVREDDRGRERTLQERDREKTDRQTEKNTNVGDSVASKRSSPTLHVTSQLPGTSSFSTPRIRLVNV